MPSPFAVTSATTMIVLRANRQGEASFTVSNVSGRPMRGRALLYADNLVMPWLSIKGDTEREFPIAATEQYTVQLLVPPDVPAGDYVFRLDMVGVENPDELYSQGPNVAFRVPASTPPPPKWQLPWWWWIAAAVAGAVILIVVLAIVFWPRSTSERDWPMQAHDAARTGYNAVERRLAPPLRVLWERKLELAPDKLTVSGGRVAVAGMNTQNEKNQVYLLDATSGNVVWNFELNAGGVGAMGMAPAFGDDMVLFGGQRDDKLYAVKVKTGALAWSRSGLAGNDGSGLYGSQIAVAAGTVYIPDEDGGIVAFRLRDGQPVWGTVRKCAWGRPLAFRNGLAFTVWGTDLVAWNTDSKAVVWRFGGADAYFPWIIAGEGYVYGRLSGNKIVALSANNGALQWNTTIDAIEYIFGSATLANGMLFVPVSADKQGRSAVVALDAATGQVRWTFSCQGDGLRNVAVANGSVYAAAYEDRMLYALRPNDGQVEWSYPLGGLGRDLAVADGKLFVLTWDKVMAFGK